MSFTAIPMPSCFPRVQASTPVEAYGPVPATVKYPKDRAPQGARYCEEVDAFVPADLRYRIRGIRKEAPRKQTLVRRILNIKHKDDNPIVLAMGLTHGKMHLVPLAQAQKDDSIRLHGIEDRERVAEPDFKTDLIPLWEAQTRPDIVYRGKNPLRAQYPKSVDEDN